MFAEKSWGSYRVLDAQKGSLTIKAILHAGHAMNYHSHERRDEVWTVLAGEGVATVDGVERCITAGDVVSLPAGCKHTVRAISDLTLMEVQIGEEIRVEDKRLY